MCPLTLDIRQFITIYKQLTFKHSVNIEKLLQHCISIKFVHISI